MIDVTERDVCGDRRLIFDDPTGFDIDDLFEIIDAYFDNNG